MSRDINVDWTVPDADGNIDVPDELMPFMNYVGHQFKFVQISGKNEILAVAHIVRKAELTFGALPEVEVSKNEG